MEDISIKKPKAKGFRAFDFDDNLMKGIFAVGYKQPTPIQRLVIPEVIAGNNVIVKSRTGSGKTACFLLPIINKLKEHSEKVGVRCIVISPSRELAFQTLDFLKKFNKFTNLRTAILVGGKEFDGQFEKLSQNPDIVIATPGRAYDHLVSNNSLDLRACTNVIIDEADKLFEQDFKDQIVVVR